MAHSSADSSLLLSSSGERPSAQEHHHHSHFERDVDADGTVVEKTVVEDVKESDQEPEGGKGKGKKRKGKAKVKEQDKENVQDQVEPVVGEIVNPTDEMVHTKRSIGLFAPVTEPTPVSPTQSHHPEIVINVNVAPPAPDVAPIPIDPPGSGSPPVHPTTIPLPPSVSSSPTATVRSMHLPRIFKRPSGKPVVATVEEEEVVENELLQGELVPTQTGLGFVENDPSWKPPLPKALSPSLPDVSGSTPQRVVQTTTVETVTFPAETGAAILHLPEKKAVIKPIPMGA